LNTDHNWGNDCVKWIEALVRTGGLTGSSGIAAG
jgi:hypothetical protein